MEMTRAHLRNTVAALVARGFVASEDTTQPGTERFRLFRGEHEVFILEAVQTEDEVRYYLEIERYYDLRSHSFRLDSWKHFPDRVEFKYAVDSESLQGLSFVLALPAH